MQILAINGSPRKQGNSSTILRTIIESAVENGAEATEVHIHSINMKGCMGCMSCGTKLSLRLIGKQ